MPKTIININNQQPAFWKDYDTRDNVFQLKELILQYANKIKSETGLRTLLDKKAFELIENNHNAFLFGLISDQSVKAEMAWSLPFRLSNRLKHLDINILSSMTPDSLQDILKTKPALHRFPGKMSKHIILACQKLKDTYQCQASKIWESSTTAVEIIDRFKNFSGIGHKKASLGVMLLVRDFGLAVPDISAIDIAYDIHIRRIFLRSELVQKDVASEVLFAARSLYPNYPGMLTTPFWTIGRNWCHAVTPNCGECPIELGCAKKIELGRNLNA